MGWPKLKYSKNEVNRSGNILKKQDRDTKEFEWAMDVLNNWRACHGYPMNTFNSTLRDKLKNMAINNAIVAQRLKRTPSIIAKLQRFKTMELAQMQDIGGLRAVVPTLKEAYDLVNNYHSSRIKHLRVNEKDYIKCPKKSGYRSIHLIYRYKNSKVRRYNELLIELQIRTKLQHVWATAVETVGTFIEHSLKSSEGPNDWLNFFALAGSGFAHLESSNPVPGYENQSAPETFAAIEKVATKLEVRGRLQAFSIAANAISNSNNEKSGSYYYHLVVLNSTQKTVEIKSFARDRLDEANSNYTKIEKKISDGESLQAVLVSAGPIETLKKAYPNYFLDTREFLKVLGRMKPK